MTYAIEVLKEKLRDELIAKSQMLQCIHLSPLDIEVFGDTERHIADLEKALEVLGRDSTAERMQHYKGVIKQGLTNPNQTE